MERIGIVGLPNAGKSALFNALTGASVAVAPHPFSTTETNVGVAQVPDARLVALSAMSASKKTVHAGVEFVDIAGLVAGSASGEGLGNRFLGGIREVDAVCLVLRAFEDPNVAGGTDPVEDLQVVELELVLADAATVENQIDKRRKAARADKSLLGEVSALQAALDVLHGGVPLYRSALSGEQRGLLKGFFLLTNKAVLAVVNLGEDQVASADADAAVRL
ncbi:MAG: GTPase, partial [Acidimicrobiales bacterium]